MSNLLNNNENNNQGNFNLPSNYFMQNAKSIANKIEWADEHKPYPTLEKLKNQHGFVTPQNYFESSSVKLELNAFPTLKGLKKQTPFLVPENYFNQNADLLGAIVNQENSVLSSIPKQNPFTVPQNYFEESVNLLEEKIKPQTKVISLFKPKVWMAAAAALFIVLGAWTFNYYFLSPTNSNCTSLACLDNKELLKTKHLNNLDDEELVKIVNVKKLEEKLNNNLNPKSVNISDTATNEALDEAIDEL